MNVIKKNLTRLCNKGVRKKKANEVSNEDFKSARAKLIEIKQSADTLLQAYTTLYEDLNNLYDQFPKLYQKLMQVVEIPTNEDASNISKFSRTLDQELVYFKDDEYLKSILSDSFYEQ